MKKIKIVMLSLIFILTIILTIPTAYGAYTFPASINASGSHINLYSNFYVVSVSKSSMGTYDSNKNFYFYIQSPIPADLVTINGTLKSTVTFYDNSNVQTVDLEFNEFSGGDLVSGWYSIPASMIPTGSSQFSMTIMSKSTSVWSGSNLLLFNNQAYYTYTSNLQLTMMIETYTNEAYQNGYEAGLEFSQNYAYNDGYNQGRLEYGDNVGGTWITASQRYAQGYNTAKNEFGLRGGVFGNADYWFSQGQLSETDLWGSLLSAFFGVFAVLSIEILPGIQLGYFVGFFLVLSVTSMIIGSMMIRRK